MDVCPVWNAKIKLENEMKEIKEKINLLFIIIQMKMGGSERLVYNIIEKIDKKKFTIKLTYFISGNAIDEFKLLNIPIYNIEKSKKIDIYAIYRLYKLIKKEKIHVVNAQHFMPLVYSFFACKINKVGLIYTEHSVWQIKSSKKIWKYIGKFLLNSVDKTIGISKNISKELKNTFYINEGKITTIYNGIDIKKFSTKKHNYQTRERLGISNKEKVIGTIGNLRKIKNHLFLIKAFKEVLKQYDEVCLIVVGTAFDTDPLNSEKEIKDYIRIYNLENKVKILGYRKDILELLNIMDIFCLPSVKEGLPISLIEAMAAGLPVVGTNVEGIKDLINNGINGTLVELNDIDALKDILLKLLKDKKYRKEMGRMSFESVKNIYSIDRCVKQHEDAFKSVANKYK